jgi:SAM-dependent methyltransferase
MNEVSATTGDRWSSGDAYDLYMGRWSRLLGPAFLAWLRPERSAHWLEVGCGTGALTSGICALCEPESVVACDQAAAFVERARLSLPDSRVVYVVATADALPIRREGFDVIVSGLVLNFIAEPSAALTAMRERARPGGIVAAYVWDYAGGLEFLRYFWDEAVARDPGASELDEARRFGAWQLSKLVSLFKSAGLVDIETTTIGIQTDFVDFDDYWKPFLGGTGPAPSHVASLSQPERELLAERLKARLSMTPDGSIRLKARALALRGVRTP